MWFELGTLRVLVFSIVCIVYVRDLRESCRAGLPKVVCTFESSGGFSSKFPRLDHRSPVWNTY